MDSLPGCYRGVVAAVDDPDERARYRVRVPQIHADDVPVAALPWAEMATAFSAKDAGDIPHYEVDDLVWVMFEGGDRRYPVIMGGWASYVGGINDLSPDQTGDYGDGRRRWVRRDRAGNTVILSEVEEELHVVLQSGQARIEVTQVGDSVNLNAEGPVNVTGKQVKVVSENAVVQADTVSIESQDGDAKLTAVDGDVILGAEGSGQAVEVGQYVDDLSTARQTDLVRVGAERIQAGEAAPAVTRLPTLEQYIEALNVLVLGHDQCADLDVKGIDIQIGDSAVTTLLKILAQQIEMGDDSTTDLTIGGVTIKVGATGTTSIEIVGESGTIDVDVSGGTINIGASASTVNIG